MAGRERVTGTPAVVVQLVGAFLANGTMPGCSTVDCSEMKRYFPTASPAALLPQSYSVKAKARRSAGRVLHCLTVLNYRMRKASLIIHLCS